MAIRLRKWLLATGMLAASAISGLGIVACTGDDSSTPHETAPDAATASDASAGADGGDGSTSEPDCYTNPKTHHEIINACTDAQAVDKKPVLPLLQPDGSLPPLQ